MTKLTTGARRAAGATAPSGDPIHALGVAGEGPRPSDPQRPIRTCACGCGRSLEGRRANTRYALTACRVREHRKRYESVTGPGRRGGPSGLQVSYAKAVRTVTAEFRLLNLPDPDMRAEVLLRGLLSDRQRARLDERGSPHG